MYVYVFRTGLCMCLFWTILNQKSFIESGCWSSQKQTAESRITASKSKAAEEDELIKAVEIDNSVNPGSWNR